MANTGKMTFDKVRTALKDLPLGDHKLIDIVAIVKKCDTFTDETLDSFIGAFYDKNSSTVKLEDLYVDLTYQRKLKLDNLLKNLKRNKGFSKEKAGHIDVARRPNGRLYVWDGFRRAIMALICDMEKIAVSIYTHDPKINNTKARQYEAELFLARNSKNEVMGANEIFFARYAKGESEAIKMGDVLHRANINICGLKPGGKNMGGFAFVEKSLGYHEVIDNEKVVKTIKDDDFIDSALSIQSAWPTNGSVGSYLVCALANVRSIIRENDPETTEGELDRALAKYAENNSQKSLTESRVSNKPLESVTFAILKKVLKKNGQSKKLSGLSDDDIAMLEDEE
jgi:hypothetical protein